MCGLGEERPNGQMCLKGKRLLLFCVFFGLATPRPQRKNYFLLRLCLVDEATGEYTVREVWHKLGKAGGGSTRWGGTNPPQSVRDATPLLALKYAPKGKGPQSGGMKWWWWRRRRNPPPPLRVKPPPLPPSHRRWPRWRPSPPPPRPGCGGLGRRFGHPRDGRLQYFRGPSVPSRGWRPHWEGGGRPTRGRPR